MNYTLTITSTDAAELAALLSGISGGSTVKGPAKKEVPAAPVSAPVSQPVGEEPGGEKITKEALRELTTEKAQADPGNPPKIKAILKKLGGATQVANLAEEHYASYYEQVSAL
jgi:hypothetical protein